MRQDGSRIGLRYLSKPARELQLQGAIMNGQYQRAAILMGLYGVNYEELLLECGLADDPRAVILSRRVT